MTHPAGAVMFPKNSHYLMHMNPLGEYMCAYSQGDPMTGDRIGKLVTVFY